MHFARSAAVSVAACTPRPRTPRGGGGSRRATDVRGQFVLYGHCMRVGRPRPWEMLLAFTGAAALVGDALYRGSGSVAIAIPLALIACLPLAWSSQKPLTSLLASTAGLIVCLAAFQPYHAAIFVLAVALYNVAALGDRRRSLIVGAATAAFVVVVIVVIADNVAINTAIRLGVVFAALVLGDTVGSRRELREARREERAQEDRRRVADERLRIARDLHDTVAHALVAINVRAGVAAHLHGSDEALQDIMAVSSDALNDLRTTLDLLRDADDPAPTAPTLDLASLTQLVERAKAAGLDAEVNVQLNGHAIPIAVAQAGFRNRQGTLTNVKLHPAAPRAPVDLDLEAD